MAGQSLNIDFGAPAVGPSNSYAAAGRGGGVELAAALHATTTGGLVGLDGRPTGAQLRQFGGLETLLVEDPMTSGTMPD